MKTPNEIKKGLTACAVISIRDIYGNEYTQNKCNWCPYKPDGTNCVSHMSLEALDLIRQLEAERDALLNETKGFCASCAFKEDCHKRDKVISTHWKPRLLHLGDCKHWKWRGPEVE